jgi:hypothetical protein
MPPIPPPPRVNWGRWTPARLIVLGAAFGFGAPAFHAAISLSSDLSLLQGVVGSVPYEAVLLDAGLMGTLVPVGLFLVLCGIALHLRAQRPPGRSAAFRAALGGAFLNLAAGLLLGLLNLSVDVVPLDLFTVPVVRDLVLALFAATVTAAVGLLVALCGLAALVRQEPVAGEARRLHRFRLRRGKSIYRGAPSAR